MGEESYIELDLEGEEVVAAVEKLEVAALAERHGEGGKGCCSVNTEEAFGKNSLEFEEVEEDKVGKEGANMKDQIAVQAVHCDGKEVEVGRVELDELENVVGYRKLVEVVGLVEPVEKEEEVEVGWVETGGKEEV